jgi:hypothetical protein
MSWPVIGSIVNMASFGELGFGLLAQNEPMVKILVPVGQRRAGVRAAGPSWTMALNSRGATDEVEAGEDVVVSEEVGMVVVRVVESIADTEKDSVVGLIIDDMAEDDGVSCDVESTTESVAWLDIEGTDEIGSADSTSVVDVVTVSIIVSDVGTLVEVIIDDVVSVDVVSVVDRGDVENVSTLETETIAVSEVVVGFHSAELVEPDIKSLVKLDVNMSSIVVVSTEEVLMVRCEYCEPVPEVKVEPVGVSNPIEDSESVEAVDAVLTKVGTVAEDVDSPNWGDEKPDVTVVLGTSCQVSRTTCSQ